MHRGKVCYTTNTVSFCRSVGTILTGLMSFMYDDAIATGSMQASGSERRRLAAQSLEASLRDPTFRKLFPEYIQELEERKKAQVSFCAAYCDQMRLYQENL